MEAEHRGAYCLLRGEDVVAQQGDVRAPCYVRSGAKWMQAVANLLSDAPTRFGLEDRHLALMCASHGGEPGHVEAAREMLHAGALTEAALDCGPHRPLHSASAARMRVDGEKPTAIHNNCSGKHAGMLLAALARGEPTDGYIDPDHPLQRFIRQLVLEFAEVPESALAHAMDGCSAPTWVMPLEAAARSFRNHGTPTRLGPAAASAAKRLHAAATRHPDMVAGTGRLCSALARVTAGRVLGKVGAEGFYGVMVPGEDVGLALHVDSGAWEVSERLVPHLLHRHDLLTDGELAELGAHADLERRNCADRVVGRFELGL